MSRFPRTSVSAVVSLTLVLAFGACRPDEPPPRMAANLGTEEQPLLPDPEPDYDPDILNIRATPVTAAEIAEEPVPDVETETEDSDGSPAEADGEVSEADRQAITKTLTDAVRAALERRFDDFGEFFPLGQADAVVTMARAGGRVYEAGAELLEVMEEKAPGFTQQALGMLSTMAPPGQMPAMPQGLEMPTIDDIVAQIQIDRFEAIGDARVWAYLGKGEQVAPLEFKQVDDIWYIRLPDPLVNPELVSGLDDLATKAAEKVSGVTAQIRNGEIPPNQLMPALMTALQELEPDIQQLAPKLATLEAELGAVATPTTGPATTMPAGEAVPEEERELIVELVELANEAVSDRDVEDLLILVPPDAQEMLTPFYTALLDLFESADTLVEVVTGASPDQGDELKSLAEALSFKLSLDQLRSIEPNLAMALLKSMGTSAPVEYVLIDGDWYFRVPSLPSEAEALNETSAFLQTASSRIAGLAERVESGDLSAEEAIAQFTLIREAIDKAIQTGELDGLPPASGEEAEAEPPPPPRSGFGPQIG